MLRYPMNMDLRGRLAVVVGAGRIAERKLGLLVGTGARLRVVARQWTPAVRDLVAAAGAEAVTEPFAPEHLDGAFLAVAATDDRAANGRVAQAARQRGVLVNVADDPEASDFHVPAVLRRGGLTVGISTEGRCPGFAHAVKVWLDGLVGPEVAVALDVVSAVRERLRAVTGRPPRRADYERLVGEPLFDACRRGDVRALDGLLAAAVGPEHTVAAMGLEPLVAQGGRT